MLISVCAAIEVSVKRQTQERGEHLGVGGEEHRRLGSAHEAWNLEGRDRKGNTTGRRIHQGPRNPFFLTEVGNQQFLPYNDHMYLEILFIDEPKNKNIEM